MLGRPGAGHIGYIGHLISPVCLNGRHLGLLALLFGALAECRSPVATLCGGSANAPSVMPDPICLLCVILSLSQGNKSRYRGGRQEVRPSRQRDDGGMRERGGADQRGLGPASAERGQVPLAANGCGGWVRRRRLDLRSARRGRGHERPGRGSPGPGRPLVWGARHVCAGGRMRPGRRALPRPAPAREPGRGQGGDAGGRAGRVLPGAGRPDADVQSAHPAADRRGRCGAGPGRHARRPVRGLRGQAAVPAARSRGGEDHRLRGGGSRCPADPPADHPVHVAYRPVAILDDDPAKRRLRIDGVPVLGGRGQMAEVAASTGARVLVIAIAGEDRQGHQGSHRGGRALRAHPEGDPVAAGTAGRPRADRRRPGSPHQRPARAPGGDLRRGLGPRAHRGPAGPGDRRGRLHRRRALPPVAPARARAADHAGPRRVGPARGPAHAARAGPARFRGDGAGRHPRPAPGQGGLRAVPARHRVPRRGAQAPAAAGTLPGRGAQEQRPGHPHGPGSRGRSWRRTRSSTSRPTRPRTR